MISKRLLGVLFACCTLPFVACNRERPDRNVDAAIKQLVDQTVAADAALIREAQISRTESRVDSDWQIATKLSQQAYFNSLRKTLGSTYEVVQQTDSELVLRRPLPGDAYEVRIIPSAISGQQLVISVHFVARPD